MSGRCRVALADETCGGNGSEEGGAINYSAPHLLCMQGTHAWRGHASRMRHIECGPMVQLVMSRNISWLALELGLVSSGLVSSGLVSSSLVSSGLVSSGLVSSGLVSSGLVSSGLVSSSLVSSGLVSLV
nr:hypothetical protein BgiMline_017031 [Biomphalaria glabrata]